MSVHGKTWKLISIFESVESGAGCWVRSALESPRNPRYSQSGNNSGIFMGMMFGVGEPSTLGYEAYLLAVSADYL